MPDITRIPSGILSICQSSAFKHNQKMGARMIVDYLTNQGIDISLGFVKSVLKAHGLVCKIVKMYKKKNTPHQSFDNKLNRQFEVAEEKQECPRVVCAITEWKLQNGTKICLCAAIEFATRAVVAYKVALNCEASLVIDVIHQVHKNFMIDNILFHSDQGSQFASKDVVDKIKAYNWTQSMSRKGNCWDNAVIESFFSTIKREELKWHVFYSFIQAERVVSEYIDNYYMRIRPHSSLGGISPIQYILKKKLSTKIQK